MELIWSLPASARVFLVFAIMLVLIRKKISLGNAFFIGALVLSFLFGMQFRDTLESFVNSITYPKTISLAIIVSLILVFSASMQNTGHLKRMLNGFQGFISNNKVNLILFPALIGLLPMPGGAIFSAPMVKELGAGTMLPGDKMSFINYWFRHIWEYCWPLYPGILLTVTLADLNLWGFMLLMSPFPLVALGLGYLAIIKFIPADQPGPGESRVSLRAFIALLSPILIVIILGLGLGIFLSLIFPFFQIAKEIGLICSLCVAIGWVWYKNNLISYEIKEVLLDKHILDMIYMVAAILIFKGILEDSHAVGTISNELIRLHVPLSVITVALPMLVGGVVGITIAFVGSTFPILIALIDTYGATQYMPIYIMLGLVSGLVGVLLSPLHLCLLLSNKFFCTSLSKVYRYLWMPCLGLLLVGIMYFLASKYASLILF